MLLNAPAIHLDYAARVTHEPVVVPEVVMVATPAVCIAGGEGMGHIIGTLVVQLAAGATTLARGPAAAPGEGEEGEREASPTSRLFMSSQRCSRKEVITQAMCGLWECRKTSRKTATMNATYGKYASTSKIA